MVALQPFEGASNRTAVMVLEKGKPTTYPVPYTVWRKVKGARFTYDSTLEEVTNATKQLNFVAEPVNPTDPTSPWLTARPKAIKAVRKVLGKSDYKAHEGVNTGGANAVYWVNIVLKRPDGLVVVRNITEGAKVKVDEVTEPIEPDLLYPLLRGRDVQRWKAEPSAWILVPHTVATGWQAISEEQMQRNYPRTWGYLSRFRQVLLNRVAYKLLRMGHPFYILKDISTYTFAPWKVVWRGQVAPQLIAAVVSTLSSKVIVPDQTAYFAPFDSAMAAHFFCALLNSSSVRFAYAAHGYKHVSMDFVRYIRIPRFDPNNPVHLRLAELSMQAHEAAKIGDEMRLREIEAEIDRWAAKLWNLTDDELRDIQQSLAELSETPEPADEE
jgi:hypothetical protein